MNSSKTQSTIIFPVPVLGFAAYSGTGKTTLLEKLIPLLLCQGIRVALIKHSHHDIEMDEPGKDSYRLRKAGASQVILSGAKRSICFHDNSTEQAQSLQRQLSLLDSSTLDIVLVEGYRDQAFPKIEVYRQELAKPLLFPNDQSIIALVSDSTINNCLLTQFGFEQLDELVGFIRQNLLKLPNSEPLV